jgi:hypothetical protein
MLLQPPAAAADLFWENRDDGFAARMGRGLVRVFYRRIARRDLRPRQRQAALRLGRRRDQPLPPLGRCRHRVSRAIETGRPLAHEAFDLRHDEAIWGFGESFGSFDQHGRTISLDLTDALGVNTQRRYKAVPFWISSHGYGAFFHHGARLEDPGCSLGAAAALAPASN